MKWFIGGVCLAVGVGIGVAAAVPVKRFLFGPPAAGPLRKIA